MNDVELSAARIIVLGALRAGRLSAAQIAEYVHLPVATVERLCGEIDPGEWGTMTSSAAGARN